MCHRLKLLIPTFAATVLLAACGSSSKSSTSTTSAASTTATQAASSNVASGTVLKTASNSTVGGTILVDAQGMTLYHLSGEQNGKFICTSSACVGVWHPLTVSAGSTPSGVASLATVRRPDGTMQVTYKGTPVYTFAQDTTPGQASGQGIKDVGTWSAVMVSGGGTPAGTTGSSKSPYSSGEGGGGGGGYGY